MAKPPPYQHKYSEGAYGVARVKLDCTYLPVLNESGFSAIMAIVYGECSPVV